jgi:hypothetical protein
MSAQHPQVLEGVIEGALAGQMGKPALRTLLFQIDQILTIDDDFANRTERIVAGGIHTEDVDWVGADQGRRPNQIGNEIFSNRWTRASQRQRLVDARTAIAALAA